MAVPVAAGRARRPRPRPVCVVLRARARRPTGNSSSTAATADGPPGRGRAPGPEVHGAPTCRIHHRGTSCGSGQFRSARSRPSLSKPRRRPRDARSEWLRGSSRPPAAPRAAGLRKDRGRCAGATYARTFDHFVVLEEIVKESRQQALRAHTPHPTCRCRCLINSGCRKILVRF